MTEEETLKLMAIVKSALPQAVIPPETTRIYARLLVDVPFLEAERAVLEYLAETESDRLPTIGAIRQRAAKRAANCPAHDEAWREVLAAVSRYGSRGVPKRAAKGYGYGPVTFSHPAIDAAVAGIGWDAICNCPAEEIATTRAQFRMAYEAASGRQVKRENVGRLEAPQAPRLSDGVAVSELVQSSLRAMNGGGK